MDVLTEKLTNLLLPVSNALNNNKHLTAVKNAMMFTIPFMIVGGIFCLLAQPPVPATIEGTNFFYSFCWLGKHGQQQMVKCCYQYII